MDSKNNLNEKNSKSSTTSSVPKRLYILTGKGGVGKTAISLALTKYLNSKGVKAKYLNFSTSSLDQGGKKENQKQDNQEIQTAKKLHLPFEALNLYDCSSEYVGKKMKSKTIGKWVVKTPFFRALLSMIPGFNYLIYLGKALEDLNSDPELTYVLDSPSSGHALTMLEATKNFGEIFQSGALFEDTQKMINLLESEDFTQINILTLPTLLALNEATQLESELAKLSRVPSKIFCNNSFRFIEGIEQIELPQFLQTRLETEREIEKLLGEEISSHIRHSLAETDEMIIEDLAPLMAELE